MINHNALHVPVFRSAALQKLLQLALSGAYGQPSSIYHPAHNRSHHRHTGTRADLMRPQNMRWDAGDLIECWFLMVFAAVV